MSVTSRGSTLGALVLKLITKKASDSNIRWHGRVTLSAPLSSLQPVWWVQTHWPVTFMMCFYIVSTRSNRFSFLYFTHSVPVSWGLCRGGLWHRGGGRQGIQTGLHLLQEKEWSGRRRHRPVVLQAQRRSWFCSCEWILFFLSQHKM